MDALHTMAGLERIGLEEFGYGETWLGRMGYGINDLFSLVAFSFGKIGR